MLHLGLSNPSPVPHSILIEHVTGQVLLELLSLGRGLTLSPQCCPPTPTTLLRINPLKLLKEKDQAMMVCLAPV